MGRIRVLERTVAEKIAAGEVVQRPASVVKELLENSLDAGATSITVFTAEGGKRLIRVVDNGSGIASDDAPLVFLRHSTSKITTEEDLLDIKTLGFRGEALASISAVSRVTIRTRERGAPSGTRLIVEGGSAPETSPDGCPEGTSVEVKDLFYNTPVRAKFLRSAETELGRIMDVVKRTALVNPAVRFTLMKGTATSFDAPAGSLRQRVSSVFGAEVSERTIEIRSSFVRGFIGTHELTYPTSRGIYTYVHGRPVTDRSINRALADGFGTLVGSSRYPFAVIDLYVPAEDVDVNIHPAKSEVRFKNPGAVYNIVRGAVRETLSKGTAEAGRPLYKTPDSPAPVVNEASLSFAPARPKGYGPTVGAPSSGLPSEVRNPAFLALEFVGQLWGEFLVAQSGEDFYLIDQHGAEERYAFETLKRGFYGSEIKTQMLLLPERVETTPEERDAVHAAMEYLKRLGFELVAFGPSVNAGGETFLVKSTPDLLSTRAVGGLVKDLAEEVSGLGGSSLVEEAIEEVLMRIACHSVIRGPRELTRQEGNSLVRKLAAIDFAGHCPHGRPVVKKFSRREVEAFFKR